MRVKFQQKHVRPVRYNVFMVPALVRGTCAAKPGRVRVPNRSLMLQPEQWTEHWSTPMVEIFILSTWQTTPNACCIETVERAMKPDEWWPLRWNFSIRMPIRTIGTLTLLRNICGCLVSISRWVQRQCAGSPCWSEFDILGSWTEFVEHGIARWGRPETTSWCNRNGTLWTSHQQYGLRLDHGQFLLHLPFQSRPSLWLTQRFRSTADALHFAFRILHSEQ